MALEPRTEPETRGIAVINLKLPPFWPSDPEVWFAQVEAQFATRGITAQKTKFEYIVASLSPEYATEVRDLILHPPATRPYDSLRDQLVKRTLRSSGTANPRNCCAECSNYWVTAQTALLCEVFSFNVCQLT